MAKAMNKKNGKKIMKEPSESASAEEESATLGVDNEETFSKDSSNESEMEYSQDQLEKAEEELEDVEVTNSASSENDSFTEEEINSDLKENSNEDEATESGSKEEEDNETLRTIFIKDIDYDLKEDDLSEQMKILGEVIRVTIPLTHDQRRNKGFAYVEFKRIEDAKKALKLNETELLGRKVSVFQARPKGNRQIFTIFVKNLSYDTTKEDLENHFGKFGKVYNISLPIDTENPERNKGFCFVEYNEEISIQKVLKAKHNIQGRTLYVNEGNKNEKRNNQRNSDRLYGRRSNYDNERSYDRNNRNNDRSFNRYRDERSNRRDDGRDFNRRDRFDNKDRNDSRDFNRRDRFDNKDQNGRDYKGKDRFNDDRSSNNKKGFKKGNKTVFADESD